MGKTALGRGFEGLIPTGLNVADIAEPGEQIKSIAIEKVFANPDQPRKTFDEHALEELAESIKQHGIIQPIIVTPKGEQYRIVAGERRFRAASLAGLKTVPVIIRNHKELEELELALVENVQRVDLSPLEQAVSIVRLREQFSLTTGDIAKKLGKAETTIVNIVRLLQLPALAIEALQNATISEGHARAILALREYPDLQKELLDLILSRKLSVRAAEEFVKDKKFQQRTTEAAKDSKVLGSSLNAIGKKFHVKAHVTTRKKGGVLQLTYTNDADLKEILKHLSK